MEIVFVKVFFVNISHWTTFQLFSFVPNYLRRKKNRSMVISIDNSLKVNILLISILFWLKRVTLSRW